MLDKIKQYAPLAFSHASRLRDIRVVGQLLFVVVVLLVSWSGVKAIDTNYTLQKQITALQQQNTLQQLENNNLKLQNRYYDSEQYLELSARQSFGLAAPGEKEVIVPQAVALSYTIPGPKAPPIKPSVRQPFYERNLEAWLNFFLHRDPATN
jgi:cell division protein FtsL